jgi:heme A synthase
VAAKQDRPTAPGDHGRDLRQWWSVITTLLVVAVFTEAVFAGAMLSGAGWARRAHALMAATLIASTTVAGLVAIVALRRTPRGPKLGWTLLALAAVIFLQAAVGVLSAKGVNLLWVHVPLGVALLGFAARAAAVARGLRDTPPIARGFSDRWIGR